jgi:hypothetical protein
MEEPSVTSIAEHDATLPKVVILVVAFEGEDVPGVEIEAPDSPMDWEDLPLDARHWAVEQGYAGDYDEFLYVLGEDDEIPQGLETLRVKLS